MRRTLLFILLIALAGAGLYIYHYYQNQHTHDALTLYGNVDVRQVDLGFRVGGRVSTMVYEEGDLVEAGTWMAQLDQQPYLDQERQARAALQSAEISLHNAQRLFDRRQELLGDGSISREDYENAETSLRVASATLQENRALLGVAKTNSSDTVIHAPTTGTILTRIREPGTIVNVGDPIYSLSVLSPVWVRAYVSESELGMIYPGMAADIYTDTPGGPVYQGHIGFISPVAEFTPKTVQTTQLRTDLVYRLRIIADNPDRYLRQGMPVTVKLPLHTSSYTAKHG
jgi:HlyD family secretion protein